MEPSAIPIAELLPHGPSMIVLDRLVISDAARSVAQSKVRRTSKFFDGRGIPSWLKIDFIGKRRLWFTISACVVAISLGALAVKVADGGGITTALDIVDSHRFMVVGQWARLRKPAARSPRNAR